MAISASARKLQKQYGRRRPVPKIDRADGIRFDGRSILFAVLLFLSGAAALIYQVLWVRQLSLIVGVEVYSITVAVSAFFAGLAAGGALIGKLADGWARPLRLYLVLEVGVAVAGVAGTLMLAHAAGPFVAIQSRAGALAWVLPLILVGAPAFLMGGTLPVAIRWAAHGLIAKSGGLVYAVNTVGGIAGALLTSFLLVPWLGVRGTALAAALFNLLAAGVAFALDHMRLSVFAPLDEKEIVVQDLSLNRSRAALALYAAAGGIAFGYEVIWTQAMPQFLSTRVFAFSILLATYLAGLAIGSVLYAHYADRVRDAWGVFGILVVGAGLVALLEIAGLGHGQLQFQVHAGETAFVCTGSDFARMCAEYLVVALGVVFVPTVLLGAAFPAVLQMAAGSHRPGRDVGMILALNTAGGIVGTLLTGFYLIPALGLVRTLSMLAAAAAAVGALAVFLGKRVSTKMQWAVYALGIVSVAVGVLTPTDRVARLLLTTRGGGSLIFYQENRGATVAVAEQQNANNNIFRTLYIQGVSNSGDAMPSMRYMRLQAMLPLIIHRGEPASALVIGFGTGITAGAVLRYPDLQRRVCAELLPAVVRAGDLFPENHKASSDSRLQIRIGDGREELLRNTEKYDIITLEPPPPFAEGVVNLYSTEFYVLAGTRLEPDGLFAQWLPIATQNDEDTRSLVRSFLDAFPYATLWTTELDEMLLIGSRSPIELDTNQIAERFNQSDVSSSLQAVGIASPAALLATWITGREGLEDYAASAPAVTDDQPRIEYAPWVRPKELTRTLPELVKLHTDPPMVGASDALRSDIELQRIGLWAFTQHDSPPITATGDNGAQPCDA